MTTTDAATSAPAYSLDVAAVAAGLESDASGLTGDEAAAGSQHGPNELQSEKPPSLVGGARAAARPDEHHADRGGGREPGDRRGLDRRCSSRLLVLLNVVLGARQELKARASVDALAKLQVPQASVLRDGAARA